MTAQRLPALQRRHQFFLDDAVARLQGDRLIQVGLVQRAVGQPGADVGLLLLQRVDERRQGVQLALVLVAQLLFL